MSLHKKFWNKEYKNPKHFSLSDEASEDLEKFTRFLMRESGKKNLNVTTNVLDMGCGNGRNLIYLSKTFGIHGTGIDISEEALHRARKMAETLPLKFEIGSVSDPLAAADASVDIALDMMVSHFLTLHERTNLREEIVRVLKPDGWLFWKGPLLEEDQNALQMLNKYPGSEKNTYIHPTLKVQEYVWTEEVFEAFYEKEFEIIKTEKSYLHTLNGKAFKRRTFTAYLRRK
ncbi:MAG TPA: class I SAM-dependent methyltransferase [Candidatus Paceibacterota bacterium]